MNWYHIKTFFRNFRANAFNSIIKTLGLTIGLVSVYLIFEYVKHESSYDKNFTDSDRIFRVIRNWQESEHFGASTSVPFLNAIQNEFPQIGAGTRLFGNSDVFVKKEKQEFHEDFIAFVDSTFFKTFNISLIQGNTEEALTGTGTLVISKTASQKYFGNEDPIGKILKFDGYFFNDNNNTFTVTGVFEDFPATCHMATDFFLSFHSLNLANNTNPTNHTLMTYLRLQNPEEEQVIERQLPDFMRKYYGDKYYEYARSEYRLQPVENIHGDTLVDYSGYETQKGNRSNLYIFPILGLLILLIASINYINLTIAEGKYKSITFGINRLTGAGNQFFFRKYFIESVLFSFLASVLAILCISLLFNGFQNLVSRPLELSLFSSLRLIIAFILISLLLGIAIGMFPALVFASKSTINFLKGNKTRTSKGLNLSAISQIVQFGICIVLFAGSIVVFKQLSFINNKISASLDNENVLLVKNPRLLGDSKTTFKQEIKKIPGVVKVSLCNEMPAYGGYSHWGFPVDSAANRVHVAQFRGDHDYLKTIGMKLIKGRFFDESYQDENSIVLNETAVKELGWENPIGKRYNLGGVFTVIGVVEDIHFESLHYPIIPQGIQLTNPEQASGILIKLEKENVVNSLSEIEKLWTTFVPAREMQKSFLNSEFGNWYNTERKTGVMALILSAIAIFLSSLGLLGMVLHSIQKRIKEIGIRKVNGAKIGEIISLLNKNYVMWVFISFLFATPIVYFLMNKWLENFAYKTTLSWWIFALAGGLALGIALLTVSFQSYKAATRNPIESLRYE